jgi:pimeloyl-ACP methyl ester carboxylesterase
VYEKGTSVNALFWAAAGLGACWAGLQLFAHRRVYPGHKAFRAGPEDTDLEVEDVEFCAEDGAELHGWWFPKPQARGVLLVCHGNAGNVADRIWVAEDLRDVPVEVFVFDYRGYGRSRGVPSERGTDRDVRAAYEVVRTRMGVEEDVPVVVYGRSLGGAVALQLASQLPVKGLILESTFTSVVDVGRRMYPWLMPQWTCPHRYESIRRIPFVKAPVLASHSPEDETVPYDLGRTLYAEAPNLWRFCELQGNHVEAGWQTSAEYAQAVREFIDEVLPG